MAACNPNPARWVLFGYPKDLGSSPMTKWGRGLARAWFGSCLVGLGSGSERRWRRCCLSRSVPDVWAVAGGKGQGRWREPCAAWPRAALPTPWLLAVWPGRGLGARSPVHSPACAGTGVSWPRGAAGRLSPAASLRCLKVSGLPGRLLLLPCLWSVGRRARLLQWLSLRSCPPLGCDCKAVGPSLGYLGQGECFLE